MVGNPKVKILLVLTSGWLVIRPESVASINGASTPPALVDDDASSVVSNHLPMTAALHKNHKQWRESGLLGLLPACPSLWHVRQAVSGR